MSVTVIALSGTETDAECRDLAWKMFCNAHPVEAFQHDPEKFWAFFQERSPGVSREEMEAMLKECEE